MSDRFATVAALVLLASVLLALSAPWLPLLDPDTVDTPNRLRPPLTPGHRLGTDEFGRDLLARLVWGARVSLLAGVATAAAAMVIGVVLSLREREFVEAARALGATDPLILGRHILPHLLSPVIVAFSLDVGAKILATAGLSFLGLGTQPPTADWGSMLATGRQFVVLSPHVVLLPGLAIFVIVLALNLVGDALRDLLDPRTHPR